MKILTMADGFGDNYVRPAWYPDYYKWTRLLELMIKGAQVNNLSRYGAGNEYITHCVQNSICDQDFVFVQWAPADRLDLWLNHQPPYNQFWQEQIQNHPVFNNNVVEFESDSIWLASNSNYPVVAEYHSKFITLKQHQTRSQLYINYVKLLLENNGIPYAFMLTTDSDYLSGMDSTNWCWHLPWRGMHSFRYQSKYAELDVDYVQPIPLVHFDFIKQFVIPKFDLPWRSKIEIDAVESMLYRKYKEAINNRPT